MVVPRQPSDPAAVKWHDVNGCLLSSMDLEAGMFDNHLIGYSEFPVIGVGFDYIA